MSLRWLRKTWKRRVWMSLLRRFHPLVEARVDGRRMRLDLRDRTLARALYLGDAYEPELSRLMEHMDLAGGVCLDVGANIGPHTLVMSRLVGTSGQVFAFEPDPRSFGLLQHNLRINGATNVTAWCCAAGDADGTGRLALNPKNRGDNRISREAPPAWASVDVPITTVDARLGHLPGGSVRFVKIDVQGYECHVLRGMTATLGRNPDAILAVEVFPDGLRGAGASPEALVRALEDLGFAGWELTAHRILPLARPWVYDLMRGGYVDLIVCRNIERLNAVLGRRYGRPVTPPLGS